MGVRGAMADYTEQLDEIIAIKTDALDTKDILAET